MTGADDEAAYRPVLTGLPARDVDIFLARVDRWLPDLVAGLTGPYGDQVPALLPGLLRLLAQRFRDRPEPLHVLDLHRTLRPDWLLQPDVVGYACYADRFAGGLRGLLDHRDHLRGLGVRYLHLMPLLRPRPGDSDGGYAVMDYRSVDPRLGTVEDLRAVCAELREDGVSVCVDLVLNHCAAEHEWAVRARAGDPAYEAMFHVFPDRTMPDAYERTLPEVFPDFAPGSFTELPERGAWVWTTFHEWQWDLNWANPRVFVEMTDVLLGLANVGVEVFRLDAVAFLWKRLGTDCQNQPEVHDLMQALRACARIVAPAVAFKAEAIVGPDQLAPYLGVGRHAGKVADLAYHNSLMVQFWSALATRDARLARHVLGRFPRKPASTAWATYLRGHDDIGWAITEEDAAAVGWSGPAHRWFLAEFFAGGFPGSFSAGLDFQANPATGDRRTSGATASLCGLDRAIAARDPVQVDLAVRRILLGHALIYGWEGIPVLYMGDEIALRNDWAYAEEPGHAGDNRWLHRPRMDWTAAARRADPGTLEGRVYGGLARLAAARAALPHLHAGVPLHLVDTGVPGVLAFVRPAPVGPLLAAYNVSDDAQWLPVDVLSAAGLGAAPADRLAGVPVGTSAGGLHLAPYQAVWLTG